MTSETCIFCGREIPEGRQVCPQCEFSQIGTDDDLEEKKFQCGEYWKNVNDLYKHQREKGLSKYGQTLEENTTLSIEQRIEHLEEELVDALQYCEHLKKATNDHLTANDYQRMSLRTAGEDKTKWLDNSIMGLCGEVGECADIVKKHRFQGHELDREKLKDELSDVCWYVSLLASALDFTLEEVMNHNIEKLKKRYPNGFSKERSIHRGNEK